MFESPNGYTATLLTLGVNQRVDTWKIQKFFVMGVNKKGWSWEIQDPSENPLDFSNKQTKGDHLGVETTIVPKKFSDTIVPNNFLVK